jgi:hypothetical protein
MRIARYPKIPKPTMKVRTIPWTHREANFTVGAVDCFMKGLQLAFLAGSVYLKDFDSIML